VDGHFGSGSSGKTPDGGGNRNEIMSGGRFIAIVFQGERVGRKLFLTLLYLGIILFGLPLWAANLSAITAPSEAETQERPLDDLNKELSNPVTSVWSIAFQQNNYYLEIEGKKDHWNSNLNFQPVFPVALTKNWNLVTRPVVTVFNSVPYSNPHNPSEIERTTGFGDTIFMEMLAPTPKLVGNGFSGLAQLLFSRRPHRISPGRESGRWALRSWLGIYPRNGLLAPFSKIGPPLEGRRIGRT